jgi:hypothetical protein
MSVVNSATVLGESPPSETVQSVMMELGVGDGGAGVNALFVLFWEAFLNFLLNFRSWGELRMLFVSRQMLTETAVTINTMTAYHKYYRKKHKCFTTVNERWRGSVHYS